MDSQVTATKLHGQVAGYLADFAGQAGAPRDVLNGSHKDSPVLQDLTSKLWSGQAHVHDLGRSYKHTPHAPTSLFFKYIVHRVKNIDKYDSKDEAHKQDHSFFRAHSIPSGPGGSMPGWHQSKVNPRHFNEWLSLNPHLIGEVLNHRDNLQSMVNKGIGLTVKMINSEPHVAMTRGLDTTHVGPEHGLSSFADAVHTGFGKHQHHMWIPVKDLWYSFVTAPPYARGEHGHENEWLFTHGGTRYAAEPTDIGRSWAEDLDEGFWDTNHGKLPELPYDTTSPDDLEANAANIPLNQLQVMHQRGKMGAKAYQAYRARNGNAVAVADVPHMPGPEALQIAMYQMEQGRKNILALHNPNLTPGDLVNIVSHPGFFPEQDIGQDIFTSRLRSIVKNPNFNQDVGDKIMEKIMEGTGEAKARTFGSPFDYHDYAVQLARYSPIPIKGLHRYFLGALGSGDDIRWSPEFAIAAAFGGSEGNPSDTPTAFNNSANAEQYLKALAHHYEQNPDDASEARNVYHMMFMGARLSDTTISNLVERSLANKPLPGDFDETGYSDLLEDTARFNPHLSPRAMIHFAKIPEGRLGLLKRPYLPEGVQLALAEQVDDIDQVSLFTDRPDFAPSAAEHLLAHAKDLGAETVDEDDLRWMGRHIARNVSVPLDILEKSMTQEAKRIASTAASEEAADPHQLDALSPLERGILDGIFYRKQLDTGHIVHPLPPGAAS